MKLPLLLFLTLPFLSEAKETLAPALHDDQTVTKHSLLEIKGGYFYFYDAPMKKVFKNSGASIQLSGSFPLITNLDLYSSIGFQAKSGFSLGSNEKTNFWQIPFDFGIKPVVAIAESFWLYFAVGPRVFYMHQHNQSPLVQKNIQRCGVGAFVNGGFKTFLTSRIFLDGFFEYSYQKTHLNYLNLFNSGQKVQLGSWVFGGGIGYKF